LQFLRLHLHLFPFLGYPVQQDSCSKGTERNHSHIKGYRTLFQEAGNHRYRDALVAGQASRNTKTIAGLIPLAIKIVARGVEAGVFIRLAFYP